VNIRFGFVESIWSRPISGRLFLCDYINPPIILKLLGQEIVHTCMVLATHSMSLAHTYEPWKIIEN